MSTYQSLKGLKVKYLSTATTGDRVIEGEIFYNSGGFAIASHIADGAWSAASNLITGRNDLAGFGTQTATACFGGVDATAVSNDTEEYNGSGWAAGEDMPSAIYEHAGTGTLTAGLSVGGTLPGGITDATNEYDGTDWAAGGDYPAATIRLQACGTQTAALAAGGGRPTISAVVCEYNGSTWTANPSPSGDLPAAIQYHRMTGILTSAVSFGGGPSGPVTGATATYNGTVWTAQTATLNDTRSRLGGAGETDSSSVAFGGFAPNGTVNTELWDGSSWTEVGNMGTARYALAGTGTKSSALGSGGYTSGRLTATEEWNISTSATTAGAWSSGENLGTAGTGMAGAGTQTAGLCAGRRQPPASPNYVGLTEEYDGSSWTEVNNLNTGRGYVSGCGTQTAAIVAGGFTGPNNDQVVSEEYDGTNWAEGDDLNTNRRQYTLFGVQTAAVGSGGYASPGSPGPLGGFLIKTEEYNGSSWSTVEDMPTSLNNHGSAGTLTAGLIFGGEGGPSHPEGAGNVVTLSWHYDGTNYAAGGAKNTGGMGQAMSGGIQTAAWDAAGGHPSGSTAKTEHYDGTSWVTAPSIATARTFGGGATAAAQPAGMIFGGDNSNATEEFTGETTALRAAKTIDFD